MHESMWVSFAAAALVAATPLLLAGLGELVAERSGVLNLGLEGLMLVGAVAGFAGAVRSGNPWVGLAAAMAAAGVLALLHAWLTVTIGADQVVGGLALAIFGGGLSSYLGKPFVGRPVPVPFRTLDLGPLADLPVLGPIFFAQDALVYVTCALLALCSLFLYRTRPGLQLRAVGEEPAAADAMGVPVFAVRYAALTVGGMLAGAAGAYLSLAYAPSWTDGMTAGRGWIALALVIFSGWHPARLVAGALLFGGVDVLAYRIQALGVGIPSYFLKMLPYALTILVLVLLSGEQVRRRLGVPAALTIPYNREER